MVAERSRAFRRVVAERSQASRRMTNQVPVLPDELDPTPALLGQVADCDRKHRLDESQQ
jgi:hypothetical protein